ncbi:hypothetical protein HAX54_020228 [Datura stramonium]|uniref:Uncharacterized protein n=1 Tax=Datura stramonium TaxID=4076 RepID=A0ABS8USP6_DATST|nr:hypothetical protein [Datura stramonium]
MLSAVIRSALGYPAFTVGTITGTPEVLTQGGILALPEWYLTDGSGPPEGGLLRLQPKLRRKGPKPILGNSEAS